MRQSDTNLSVSFWFYHQNPVAALITFSCGAGKPRKRICISANLYHILLMVKLFHMVCIEKYNYNAYNLSLTEKLTLANWFANTCESVHLLNHSRCYFSHTCNSIIVNV